MRGKFWVVVSILLFSLIIFTGDASVISISKVLIEPTGYEDQSAHEWKGSFWVITATVDTTESYLLFNEATSAMSGLNSVDGKAIVPTSAVKITITPRQPYWEIPLVSKTYMVYPKTYGTDLEYWLPTKPSKRSATQVSELDITVFESSADDVWTLYTPFDVTIEKEGSNPFKETVQVTKTGGTDTIIVTNPIDDSEKVMINNLGKLYTGLGQPQLNEVLIIDRRLAFKRNEVIYAIKYPTWSDELTPNVDENYALYWFGGGDIYKTKHGEHVKCWDDDHTPKHVCKKYSGLYDALVEEEDFPGSHRLPDTKNILGVTTWTHVEPIAASIFNDNPASIPYGLSLVNYLTQKFPSSLLDLNRLFGEGWTITADNKLRIYTPTSSASSLITIKISSELADSVVYQPLVGCPKCEQVYWDSTKTTTCAIRDKDTVVLRVKQYSTSSSRITVIPSGAENVPIAVTPLMNSEILDPGGVHDFQFEIRNLGTETKEKSTITFTLKNDLGTVTDNSTLDFELLPYERPAGQETEDGGYPLWTWLAVVASVAIATIASIGIYRFYSLRKKKTPTVSTTSAPIQPPATQKEIEKRGFSPARKRFFRRKFFIASLILLSIVAGLGVYYYDAYHKLELGLVGFGVGDVGYTSAEVRLTLEVKNPNLLPIYIPNGDFEIYINDQHIGSGHFSSVIVGGNGRARIRVPVTFYYFDVPFVVCGLITGGGRVTVKLEGAAHIIIFDMPFSSTLYDAEST